MSADQFPEFLREGRDFVRISLDGSPATVADGLIRSSLPETFLDQIDISTQEGLGELIRCVLRRRHQAAIEKDELIRFVERNRSALCGTMGDMLKDYLSLPARSGKAEAKPMGAFFEYFRTNLEHALAREYQQINLKSDRLFWLVYALAHQLASRKLAYAMAQSLLRLPVHRERISPLTIGDMLQQFVEEYQQPQAQPIEMVLVLVECGLLADLDWAVLTGFELLAGLPPSTEALAWADLQERAVGYLEERGRAKAEHRKQITRVRARFGERVSDDDF